MVGLREMLEGRIGRVEREGVRGGVIADAGRQGGRILVTDSVVPSSASEALARAFSVQVTASSVACR